jgi:hypothetical protein
MILMFVPPNCKKWVRITEQEGFIVELHVFQCHRLEIDIGARGQSSSATWWKYIHAREESSDSFGWSHLCSDIWSFVSLNEGPSGLPHLLLGIGALVEDLACMQQMRNDAQKKISRN